MCEYSLLIASIFALAGIPMLGIPLYGSNYANLRKVEQRGLGIILDKNDVSEKTLLKALRELLDNPK